MVKERWVDFSETDSVMLPCMTARTVLEDGGEGRSWWFLLAWFAPLLAQGLAFQLDAIGVVNEAVQDAVGEGGIADLLMPGQDQGKSRRSASFNGAMAKSM